MSAIGAKPRLASQLLRILFSLHTDISWKNGAFWWIASGSCYTQQVLQLDLGTREIRKQLSSLSCRAFRTNQFLRKRGISSHGLPHYQKECVHRQTVESGELLQFSSEDAAAPSIATSVVRATEMHVRILLVMPRLASKPQTLTDSCS